MERQFDTLVLPGGGIKGFNLLGAIQCLIDRQQLKHVKTYVGTSVGAMIGYLLAIGYTPIEIVVAFYKHNWLEKISKYDMTSFMSGMGIMSFMYITEILEKLTINKIGRLLTMEMLQKEFGQTLICCTYNMTDSRTEYLNPIDNPTLPCLTALRMTANIPLFFGRFKYTSCYYIDGGIADNFPVLYAESISDNVLAINMVNNPKNLVDNPSDGMLSYLMRLSYVPIISLTRNSVDRSSSACIYDIETGYIINPVSMNASHKKRLEMFSDGYEQARLRYENLFMTSSSSESQESSTTSIDSTHSSDE